MSAYQGDTHMMTITFRTYSPILDKFFVNVKEVKSMEDFTLYARALYSGNWEIVDVK